MVHDCLFIYIAAGHHIWRSFPYPPPGDAAGSLQQGPNIPQASKEFHNLIHNRRRRRQMGVLLVGSGQVSGAVAHLSKHRLGMR